MARFSRFSRKPRFRRFRRKGYKGTWLPVNGSLWQAEGGDPAFYDASITDIVGPVNPDRASGPFVATYPVTKDYSYNAAPSGLTINEQPSLRDYVEGNEYLLKRILGRLRIYVIPDENPPSNPWSAASYWTFLQIGAGFFVAQAGVTDPTLPDLTELETDPLDGTNTQDPWIWRKTWILANPHNQFALPPPGNGVWEHETIGNTGLPWPDGPEIDAKSVRRIRREERLWFSISAIGWDALRPSVGGAALLQPSLSFNLDARFFGKMVRGRNNSVF